MKKLISIALTTLLAAGCAVAADQAEKVQDRVQGAANVLQEIMAAPDKGIPEEILSSADCVAIVPSMKNGGFVVGARYGRGIATCRNNGAWSAPAPFLVEGGSWGLQIGGQAIDLVMLVMNQQGMQQLLSSKFKVGADASAAAGPVGRHAEGSTDWKMRSQILTYSRARGAFAGITLNGAVVKQDNDATQELYGRVIPFKQILTGSVPAPASTQPFLTNVAKYFHAARAESSASATRVNDSTSPSTQTTGGTTGTASTPQTSSTTSTPAGSSAVSSQQTTTTTTTTTTAPAGSTSGMTTPSTSTSSSDTSAPSSTSSTSTSPSTSTSGEASSGTGTSSTTPTSTSGLSNSDVKDLIQRALRNETSLSSSNVNVVVTENEVQLSGTVASQTDKDTVRSIATQNAGSRKVSDADLTVK
jgi:lipid-binding SYLF domain-containing protein